MNRHLNIFRYYNDNQAEFIENNLSRAFAICLDSDSLFFSKYIQSIVDENDYDYLFNYFETDSRYQIDLQVNTNSFELTGINKVYAVAMTADRNLDMQDFLSLTPNTAKETNLTDVLILIKDIAIVIEVKRYKEDCKQQLLDQIVPFINANIPIIPKNFSWKDTIVIMEQVANLTQLKGDKRGAVADFVDLAEIRYPGWFSSRPFNHLPALLDYSPKTRHARNVRFKQIVNHSDYKTLPYSDRLAIGVNFGWASEIIPTFRQVENVDYIVFHIWPGNTKGQGYRFYDKPLDWINKKSLNVAGNEFRIKTSHHIKFSHFNRYVTSLDFGNDALLKPINTKFNFYNRSGKWSINRWKEFEAFMDEHLKPEFNWRQKCGFDEHFTNKERTYFTVSLGFMVDMYVPYKLFQEIDQLSTDYQKPSQFINELVSTYAKLTD